MQRFNIEKSKNCIAFTPLEIERKRKRSRFLTGFTLIEMLVVLIIISIITAATLPYFFSFYTGQELKTSARVVASVLRTAKSYATTKNTDCWVEFTPSTNKLEIAIYHADVFDEDGDGNTTESVQQGKTEKLELATGVVFSTSFTNDKVTFTPQGTCNGGTVEITNTSKSKEVDISVSPVTARVSISDIEPPD